MEPEVRAAMINSAAQLASTAGQIVMQGNANKKNRKWAESRYNQQRKDSLADWNMQNEYNSPEAQMRRLKAAGLNPNLVYGNGTVANNSQQVKSADTPSFEYVAPRLDLSGIGSYFNQMYELKMRKEQISNLEQQRRNMEAQERLTNLQAVTEMVRPDLIGAQTQKYGVDMKYVNQKISQNEGLYPYIMEFKKAQIENMVRDTEKKVQEVKFSKHEDIRRGEMNTSQIAKNTQSILLMAAQTAESEKRREQISEAIKLTKTKRFQEGMENILRVGGKSFRDSYLTRSQAWLGIAPEVDRVFKAYDPAYGKLSDNEKRKYILDNMEFIINY